MKIDDENSVPVKTIIGGPVRRRPYLSLPKELDTLKVKLLRGEAILNVDRKNKILWMPYEEVT